VRRDRTQAADDDDLKPFTVVTAPLVGKTMNSGASRASQTGGATPMASDGIEPMTSTPEVCRLRGFARRPAAEPTHVLLMTIQNTAGQQRATKLPPAPPPRQRTNPQTGNPIQACIGWAPGQPPGYAAGEAKRW
jgi:hypothetical protein